jgi:hypothetical protein
MTITELSDSDLSLLHALCAKLKKHGDLTPQGAATLLYVLSREELIKRNLIIVISKPIKCYITTELPTNGALSTNYIAIDHTGHFAKQIRHHYTLNKDEASVFTSVTAASNFIVRQKLQSTTIIDTMGRKLQPDPSIDKWGNPLSSHS